MVVQLGGGQWKTGSRLGMKAANMPEEGRREGVHDIWTAALSSAVGGPAGPAVVSRTMLIIAMDYPTEDEPFIGKAIRAPCTAEL